MIRQLPTGQRYTSIGDNLPADANPNRLMHNDHRLQLKLAEFGGWPGFHCPGLTPSSERGANTAGRWRLGPGLRAAAGQFDGA